ncbi:hypothetical protein Q4511_09455 [Paracoccus sp. 1_MG-2023]|uniref:hypothetical protein n=1 Tax=unclassified Paracoccus (in: a-proteobacteria) TaxID=2688777 RepID=UPI001C08B41C|nr:MULTISPECIES: hypothetical protein [unclassified Paracoccus (in: a-proteobacteria)]MBU2957262.1 hypothetical protein [Paracoccus sp. C2R09]MDO6669149.1 hypothetical protein [Paracoccus sp. 1_MG-2023]
MTDRRTLYLHIGVHRTATTAIQAAMARNWELLRNNGFLYPYRVERHIGVFNDIFSGRTDARTVGKDLVRRAANHPNEIHTLVMSDEDVSMREDLGPLQALADSFDVKVIFAMRRQDLWLESWWAQNVKGQWDRRYCHKSWPDFIRDRKDFHWIDYHNYINHIESVFGVGSVRPYVFERSQMPDGPIAEFCKQFGFTKTRKLSAAGGSNISLTPEVSEFVRQLPLIEAPMKLRLKLIEIAESVDREIRKENPALLMIPHAERVGIMKEYQEGNDAVAKRFFARDKLFLEPLPSESEKVVQPALPQDSYTASQRLFGPFIGELIRQLKN